MKEGAPRLRKGVSSFKTAPGYKLMAGEFKPRSIEKTGLWLRLSKPFGNENADKLARTLAADLPTVCQLAVDRMKLMPTLHGEFTLHDETHLLRVTELMARVIPDKVLSEVLNPAEIALLILAAHFHDIGMVPDAKTATKIRQSDEYQLARQNLLVEYVGFKEAVAFSEKPEADSSDRLRARRITSEFEQMCFARFIRDAHARHSADFVKDRLAQDPRLHIGTGHLADSLALLCVSHNWPPERLTTDNGFYYDKAIGVYQINLAYLSAVLRLADILDFDRERTPAELYRSISFSNPISIQEWEKHRQVDGWKIDRDAVRFECACERPEYELAVRRFLNAIDEELGAAHDLVRRFPRPFAAYSLDLPARADRSRVGPKDSAYIYVGDLEITLSRDEIVRLLMTEKLYGHPSLAIRELLQNAWDALRHRRAIMARDDGVNWNGGRVDFEHGVNSEGREYVTCVDNGVGMDERVVRQFLIRVGRSYYRSPEFERERLTFAKAKADFDPCARFGIGFMSAFMLGDQIRIATRRYHGSSGGLGQPLVVELNGVGGLIVLRRGSPDQPAGTTVEIVGRRKPDRFATWIDRVHLVDTLYSYALAGEFPIFAKCSIPEIEEKIEIPPTIAEPWHPLVEFDVKQRAIFEQEFSATDPRLQGKVMCGFPLDKEGHLAVATDNAGWKQGKRAEFYVKAAKDFQVWTWEGRTCIDGILVAGPHGRGKRGAPLVGTQHRNPINFGEDLFVLDVRGELKPELTPERAPPRDRGVFNDAGPTWRRLRRIATRAHGLLWEQVIDRFKDETEAKALWQLMALHHVQFSSLRRGVIWNNLRVPSIDQKGKLFFRRFDQLGAVPFGPDTREPFACEIDGRRIGIDDEMAKWKDINDYQLVAPTVRRAVVGMATLALRNDSPTLQFVAPDDPNELGFSSIIFDRFSGSVPTMEFGSGLEGALAAIASIRVINKRHPVAQYLLSQQENVIDEPEFLFLHALAGALTEPQALEALATGDYQNTRFNWHFSTLGYYFRNVDTALLSAEHRPPYHCWLPRIGSFPLTEKHLEELAKVQMIDWHRREKQRRD